LHSVCTDFRDAETLKFIKAFFPPPATVLRAARPAAHYASALRVLMEPLLSELGMAVDAIESRYCTSGQWLMPSALKLQLSKETSPVSFPMPHGQQEKELSRIRAAAEPSPFGHGNQTVVDTTVRKAHQLMPDQVVLSGGFNGTLPADILESRFSSAQRPAPKP